MHFRAYRPEKDKKSVLRIYREVGWYDPEADKDDGEKLFSFLDAGHGYVSEIRDEAECMVCTHDGTLQYLDEKLSLCCITGVTTSRVARKQNLATRLTAMALAEAAVKGDEVA